MARLFRSRFNAMPPPVTSSPNSPSFYGDDEDEGYFGDFNSDEEDENPATTPFITPAPNNGKISHEPPQFSVLAVVAAALRRSLVTCSVEADDVASDVDISWPTDVRHVSHVTFDRFDGFLGLPLDLQPHVPPKPPSASASVFGVSAQSMQCSYDQRGNSVPTILLRMQTRLYSEGGLRAEGIFRITAENSQEENVRKQLNKGVVPHGIDVHCLSGLIKAWFRELPSGVLDCLTPEQVMHCNTEQDCTHLINQHLPPTEAALLDWAINLMVDVVDHEHYNKMNARNIAMVFAPNMTQMADPLTALIHAVQVMNFLKTLIIKTHRQRQLHSEAAACNNLLRSSTLERQNNNDEKTLEIIRSESDVEQGCCRTSPGVMPLPVLGHTNFKDEYEEYMEAEGILNRLSLRKGMQKLCRHPVFQLSKIANKSRDQAAP
ncbi:hypothetical protein ACS0TY_019543 [Phlomoides rotata]